MHRPYIPTFCIALIALLVTAPVSAEVALLSDIVAGRESSSITPVGRLSDSLLMVADNGDGGTDLFISQSPSGAIARVRTLSTSSGPTTTPNGGTFFSVPSGFSVAGTHWFTDGTDAGTFVVPFDSASVFQRNGAEVFYKNGSAYTVGRFNLATGLHEPSYISGSSVAVRAIIGGVPFGITVSGVVYAYDLSTKRWTAIFDSALDGTGTYAPVYTGDNNDKLLFGAAERIASSTYAAYVYDVTSNLSVRRRALLGVSDYPRQVNVRIGENGWTFTMSGTPFDENATWDSYVVEPYVANPYRYDSAAGVQSSTMIGSLGFVAKAGRLYSFTSMQGAQTPHEYLSAEGGEVTVRALRIVGDTLLIFGSTPSRGDEVWSVPTDICPSDISKLYPASCGCGVADSDSDGDGTPDCLDGCPRDRAKIAAGTCGCGQVDADPDGDGTMSCVDLCPTDPKKIGSGSCGCGFADTDTDGDGTADCKDSCVLDANKTAPGLCGCGVFDADSDQDGTMDCREECPSSAVKTSPGVCGCNVSDTDSDRDGAPDCIDPCRLDALKIGAGVCGCGVSDVDTDGDGAPACLDACPFDDKKTQPGVVGCGGSDKDSDGDSVPDVWDLCPTDLAKSSPGVCGCNVSERDSDNDGRADCSDECADDAGKILAGSCGCGVAETDTDHDSFPDCLDLCPEEPGLAAPVGGSCDPLAQVVDLCPLDPSKLAPGVCGCGEADTDSNGDGTPDCKEYTFLTVDAPRVSVRGNGRTARLVIGMQEVASATYQVEATRLDRKISKPMSKSSRSQVVTLNGVPTKSRWSVRYRVVRQGRLGAWSSPTQVRVR